jgi:hypothetical protein
MQRASFELEFDLMNEHHRQYFNYMQALLITAIKLAVLAEFR